MFMFEIITLLLLYHQCTGLDALPQLEELYIADNGLTNLKGLDNQNLQTLEVANNKVSDISGR